MTMNHAAPILRDTDVDHSIEVITSERSHKVTGVLAGFLAVVVGLFAFTGLMFSGIPAPGEAERAGVYPPVQNDPTPVSPADRDPD